MTTRRNRLSRTRWHSAVAAVALGWATLAPSTAPVAGEVVAGTHGGRAYKLFVPSGLQAGSPVALLVMLHGCTQDPDSFAHDTEMNELAEAERFLVLYPEQPSSRNERKCWNWFLPANQARGQGEPAEIVAIVERVKSERPVDGNRVYVAGLSAGAAMSVVLGATYPDQFAAIGVAAGLPYGIASNLGEALNAMARPGASVPNFPGVPGFPGSDSFMESVIRFQTEFWRRLWFPNLNPNDLPASTVLKGTPDPDRLGQTAFAAMGQHRRVVPVIVFHGTADQLVKPVNGDEVIAQWAQTDDLASDGVDNDDIDALSDERQRSTVPGGGRSFTALAYKDRSGRIVMRHYVIEGMGHAWSGGSPTGSTSPLAGPLTDPRGPESSRLMLEFFAAHPKSSP